MPGQQLFQPNPPPDPSQLDDAVMQWSIKLETKNFLSKDELNAVQTFRRAADYIAAAMIFLNDTGPVLLEQPLTHDQIKPRLLGHWGTCPGNRLLVSYSLFADDHVLGLTLVYAHLNRIIRKTGLDALYVVGPGRIFYLSSKIDLDLGKDTVRRAFFRVSGLKSLWATLIQNILATTLV